MLKKLALAIACVSLFAACGKKNADQVTVQAVSPAPVYYPGQGYVGGIPGPQIQGSYPYFFVNYEIVEASCTTGLRRFSGPTAQYVYALMCDSLRNDTMHQSCGYAQRQAWLATICR